MSLILQDLHLFTSDFFSPLVVTVSEEHHNSKCMKEITLTKLLMYPCK